MTQHERINALPHDGEELARIYEYRFRGREEYRRAIWKILIKHVFSQWIPANSVILDLGTGQGEFINQVTCARKLAMDLNPRTREALQPDVQFIEQDCATQWTIAPGSLDIIFTSNFFEHLPDKAALRLTLEQAFLALRPGGRLIAMGPNIRLVPGAYWDFWDHYVPLTERSLGELGLLSGFLVEHSYAATLPYSMSQGFAPPKWCVHLYCRMSFLWPWLGKQFIVVLRKP